MGVLKNPETPDTPGPSAHANGAPFPAEGWLSTLFEDDAEFSAL